ncbi:helix-turn-helix transcriptional regulator [Aliiglaciecola sp. M165]|uniref:helix-turn-helix transcriptional regulator n=1 Tax=Aliiglaciecola sp. M165 TaxID=2593649 RepID=UPI00117EFFC3|nr:AlpA family phage regulatory protein [Aliiglaciecola sp. M165]
MNFLPLCLVDTKNMSEKMKNYENLRLIDRATVCKILGISSTTLWRLERSNSFIPRIYLSLRRIAFSFNAVQQWIEQQTL